MRKHDHSVLATHALRYATPNPALNPVKQTEGDRKGLGNPFIAFTTGHATTPLPDEVPCAEETSESNEEDDSQIEEDIEIEEDTKTEEDAKTEEYIKSEEYYIKSEECEEDIKTEEHINTEEDDKIEEQRIEEYLKSEEDIKSEEDVKIEDQRIEEYLKSEEDTPDGEQRPCTVRKRARCTDSAVDAVPAKRVRRSAMPRETPQYHEPAATAGEDEGFETEEEPDDEDEAAHDDEFFDAAVTTEQAPRSLPFTPEQEASELRSMADKIKMRHAGMRHTDTTLLRALSQEQDTPPSGAELEELERALSLQEREKRRLERLATQMKRDSEIIRAAGRPWALLRLTQALPMWEIYTKRGRATAVYSALYDSAMALKGDIQDVTLREHDCPNRVYARAKTPAVLATATHRLGPAGLGVRRDHPPTRLSAEASLDIMTPSKVLSVDAPPVHGWVRLRTGYYTGDIGRVVARDLQDGYVTVMVVPRIPSTADSPKSKEGYPLLQIPTTAKKTYVPRPPPGLFHPERIRRDFWEQNPRIRTKRCPAYEVQVPSRRDGTTSVSIPETVRHKVNGHIFIHGYLLLSVPIRSVDKVAPSIDEVQAFNSDSSRALNKAKLRRVVPLITQDWNVRIQERNWAGFRGVVTADRGSQLDVMVVYNGATMGVMEFSRNALVPNPCPGDSVDVAVGQWTGRRGLVQRINEEGDLEVVIVDATPARYPRVIGGQDELPTLLTISPLDVDQVTFKPQPQLLPPALLPTADASGTEWGLHLPPVVPGLTEEELRSGGGPKLTTGSYMRHPLLGKDVVINKNALKLRVPSRFDANAQRHKGEIGSVCSISPLLNEQLIATVSLHGIYDKPPVLIPVDFLSEAPRIGDRGPAVGDSKALHPENDPEVFKGIPRRDSDSELARFQFCLPPIDEEPMGHFRRKVLSPETRMFMVSSGGLHERTGRGLLASGLLVKVQGSGDCTAEVEGSAPISVEPHYMEGNVGWVIAYNEDKDIFRICFAQICKCGKKTWSNAWIPTDGENHIEFDIPGIFVHPVRLEKGMFVAHQTDPFSSRGYIHWHNGFYTPLVSNHSKARQVMKAPGFRYKTVEEMTGVWYAIREPVSQ